MKLIAYIDGFNQGEDFLNAAVRDINDVIYNIKFEDKTILQINNIYMLELEPIEDGKRHYNLISADEPFNYLSLEELENHLKHFYKACPKSIDDIKNSIEEYLEKIENKDIYNITKTLYERNKKAFYVFPAASKFHHAYIGGLAYHTNGMLELSKSILERYKSVNADLVYAGIILHDMAKVYEFNRAYNTEYSLEGTLVGHLVMGSIMIENVANELKIDSEAVLLLKHIVLSHHGQYQFGSPKKPLIAEALVVSFLDNIDSKMTVVEEELNETKVGEFTSTINVIEKSKLYKHKLSE